MIAMIFRVTILTATPIQETCALFSILMSIFLHGASVWTCIIGFHILWTAQGRFPSKFQEFIYICLAIGLPLIYVLVMYNVAWKFTFTSLEGHPKCLLNSSSPPSKLGFAILRTTFFSFNVIILAVIIYKVRMSNAWNKQLRQSKCLTLVFIQLCYLIYTTSSMMAFVPVLSPPALLASTIVGELQGLLNSIVVGRKPVTKQLTKLIKLYKEKRLRNREVQINRSEGGEMILKKVTGDDIILSSESSVSSIP